MIPFRVGAHLPDAHLVRVLDGELDNLAHRRAQDHLRSCVRCSRKLAELEDPSRVLREALAAVPVALPDTSRKALALSAMERASRRRPAAPRPVWVLRAAAVAGLVMVAAVSAHPSRTWMLRRADRVSVQLGLPRVAEWLVGLRPAPAAEPPVPVATPVPPAVAAPVDERVAGAGTPAPPIRKKTRPAPPRSGAAVSFAPRGEELVLEFDSFQEEGTLTLWIRDVPEASARVIDGARGESFRVLSAGLRVRNTSASYARYEVVVPQRVQNVRIRVAGRPKAWIGIEPSGSSEPWLWTVDLQQRRAP